MRLSRFGLVLILSSCISSNQLEEEYDYGQETYKELNIEWVPSFLKDSVGFSIKKGEDTTKYVNITDGKGVYVDKFESGNVFVEGNYNGWKPHGTFKRFWPKGNLRDKIEFQNGVFHGQRTSFYESGKIKFLCYYNESELIYLKYFREDGAILDSYATAILTGDIVNPSIEFGDTLNFSFGMEYAGSRNPSFEYYLFTQMNDTLIALKSQNKIEKFKIPNLPKGDYKLFLDMFEVNEIGQKVTYIRKQINLNVR